MVKYNIFLVVVALAVLMPLITADVQEKENHLSDQHAVASASSNFDGSAELSDSVDMEKRYRLMGKRLFGEDNIGESIEEDDDDDDENDMDKRYRLMGKRYRLMGKRYRLMGKRYRLMGKRDSGDDDENNMDKRYRLMGKRYRLMGRGGEPESVKRYRIYGRK